MVRILGEMNERRVAVVRAAFNKIDLDKSGVVELNEVKRWYNTKNNPQVLSGEITEEDLYSRFIETFGNHHNLYSGIRDKRVTWNEFLDYYKFISFVVPDDDLFEGILVSAWKLENTGEYINSQRNEDMKKIKMLEQNLEEKQGESIRGKKNLTSGGVAPFGVDKDYSVDYSTTSNNKLRGTKKKLYEEEPKEEPNIEYNNYINKKQYQNQNQTQYQKFSYQAEGESALNILKDIIYQRGTRGILGMRRSFMIDDEDNAHILTFESFYKYINNFLIPLSRNQAIALFKLYDKKNAGEIIYDNLINEIVGNLSDERKYLINLAYEKISGGKEAININVMRNKFYPAGHPDVVVGRRTEQEVLSEFLDNMDYHFNLLNQGRNDEEEITNQDFIDFYRYISVGIISDGDFKKIINGVWSLERQKRFSERRYY
jgi:Ca2+-binding EF-hand superfamily protein